MAETLGELQERTSRMAAAIAEAEERCTELARERDRLHGDLRALGSDASPKRADDDGLQTWASHGFHLGMWWPALIVVVIVVLVIRSAFEDDDTGPTELAGIVLESARPDVNVGTACSIVVFGRHHRGHACRGTIRCGPTEVFGGALVCTQDSRLDGEGEDASFEYTLAAVSREPRMPAHIEVDRALVTAGDAAQRVTIILEEEVTESEVTE